MKEVMPQPWDNMTSKLSDELMEVIELDVETTEELLRQFAKEIW